MQPLHSNLHNPQRRILDAASGYIECKACSNHLYDIDGYGNRRALDYYRTTAAYWMVVFKKGTRQQDCVVFRAYHRGGWMVCSTQGCALGQPVRGDAPDFESCL